MNNYKSENKKKKSTIFINIIKLIIIILAVSIFLPNFNRINYKESLGLAEDDIITIFNNNYVKSNNNIYQDEIDIFLSADFIKEYIDPYIFWDKEEDRLTITNENSVIRMKTEQLEYFVNNKPLKLDTPFINIENMAYIPLSFLSNFYSEFKFDFQTYEENKVLNIKEKSLDETTYFLKNKTVIRTEPTKKSPIVYKTKQKDEICYLIPNSSEESGYLKIVTQSGYIGYVKKNKLTEFVVEKSITENNNISLEPEIWKPQEGKINLVFEQMTTTQAVRKSLDKQYPSNIDVLVPTFFSFLNENGDIKNIADKSYIDNAHLNGFKVWGLLTDNFDKKISHGVLSSTEIREHVIKQILAFVSIYNLDGINIDFESVPTNDGEYFVQFLRELAPLLKQQGAVLSVDLFVPKPWTSHYMREEVGKVVDYVIVMGYDEHYAGSKQAGSVASISWSEEAIVSTLNENVPKEKLILGVPFYTRVWQEENNDGKISLSSKAYGMNSAYEFITEKGGEFNWLEDMGQYYGEVTEGNTTYKVWLEDETSLSKRLDLILDYDIAGCGAWKLWLEKDEVWSVLDEKLKQ